MNLWYESLESQLKWAHYNKLIKIVQPSPADWRAITTVSTAASPDRKPSATGKNATPHQPQRGGNRI